MNAKDLRTDSALGASTNDGCTKFTQSGNSFTDNSNKSYQDIGTNSLAKVDVQTSRPCAIIGPDRVLSSTNCNDGFAKKGLAESWSGSDSLYRQPPDYPHKISEYQPTRNISPRQTFQENMQRIMVTPYSTMKKSDDVNIPMDRNASILKKMNMASEAKYCEVPFLVNPACNEQKSARPVEIPASNVNPGITRSTSHGWPPNNVNIRPLRPYGAHELYQYMDYPSCAGPRPIPMVRPHRTIHDEPGRIYPEQYYQDGNIRFKPYPPTKGRYPQGRYDYISNYSNTFHPPPPFPPHAFDPQKSVPSHSYPLYPQVPLKYIERRMGEPIMDGYQRHSPQANLNVTYHNPIIHPQYGPLQPNCIQNNIFPYPTDNSKSVISNKLPYTNNSKIYVDYETTHNKKNALAETVYSKDRTHCLKSEVVYPNYQSVNVHGVPQHPFYRKENVSIKNFEYMTHLRNIDPSINFHNPLLRRPIHFSPNGIAISPSDSNTSNDTTQTHSTTQEDCGYVSQSSTTSGRSLDFHTGGFPNEHYIYRPPDYRYGFLPRHLSSQIPNSSKGSKAKKDLDVRQFLQMWNEGDDESGEQNKDESNPKGSKSLNNLPSQYDSAKKQEQLYVLGLVNVPSEELGKYDHIQKISKLPENIKGYNNVELLNQFEEAIESSNKRNYNMNLQRDYHTQLKSAMSKQSITASPRPVSPLDVEAKISQSVIHKEVGCNFEIKPCSPKMLNVEIATPIQNILDERIIEKVSNSISTTSVILHKGDKMNIERNNFTNPLHNNATKEGNLVPSCTMDNLKYTNDHSIEAVKENYSLHDLEYNSSVCLASLPRLDNDIELNFPEINQQFINANNMEPVITPTSVKDLPMLDSDQMDKNTSNNKTLQLSEVAQCCPSAETDKEFTKLSKYRKLKKTDFDQNESHSQSRNSNKTQFRTDSVIIENPDMMKNHENDLNNTSAYNNNKHFDLNIRENNVTSPANLTEETAMVSTGECININNNSHKNSNLATIINNVEEKASNVSTDTAIDFSINKSDTELLIESPLKENTVSESLLNFIEEDLNISETFVKAELSTIAINGNNSNDIDESLNLSDDKALFNKLGQETLETNVTNITLQSHPTAKIKDETECGLVLPQKEACYENNNINLTNTINTSVSITDYINVNENLVVLNDEQEETHNISETISLDIIPQNEKDSKVTGKDGNVNCMKKNNKDCLIKGFENERNEQEISEEQCITELDKKYPIVPDTHCTPDSNCLHNDNNENSNVEIKLVQSASNDIVDSNLKLLDVKKLSNDKNKITENKIIGEAKAGKAVFNKKDFYFKKRLYCPIVQSLIIFSEKEIVKKDTLGLLLEKETESVIITHMNNCVNLPLQENNKCNLDLLPAIVNEVADQSVCIDVIYPEKALNTENNIMSIHTSSEIVKTNSVNGKCNCDNDKDDLNKILHINSESVESVTIDQVTDPEQVELKDVDFSLKDCPEENRPNIPYTEIILSNKQTSVESGLQLIEIDSDKVKKDASSYMFENESLNIPQQVYTDHRVRIKRSLSDSAINIYTNDELKNIYSENMYPIPKKRKKINPCEVMEPNVLAANLCNIIQTNRRNSISTLYDEENVSFCILIDNSCVLTEDKDSQKICLTDIPEDAYEGELRGSCTFKNVIFTDISPDDLTCSTNEDISTSTKVNSQNIALNEDFANEYTIDEQPEDKTFGEVWIEDVACIETVFSDGIDDVLDAPSSPKGNLSECEIDAQNESLIYNDFEHMNKIKYFYGNEICTDDAELVETLYRTPQMDVKKTLIRRESHYSDESNRYYDNDSLEKILSESNDKVESDTEFNIHKSNSSCPNSLQSSNKQNDKENLEFDLLPQSNINVYPDSDCRRNACETPETVINEPTQYDIVHSCESTCDYMISYKPKNESRPYCNSSSPEVSSTTYEEKSCGILLKITKCNGSISSQINEFNTKSTSKLNCKLSETKELLNDSSNLSRKRPLITKAAQKYIPPLKETIRDLKVKLPLPQHSLNKLKILKISKDKPKADEAFNKSDNSLKPHYPKKSKPKFEDVLKSIDEIQIKMHREKNKKQKHSIPKVVIKKNENGNHYASTSNVKDTFNPDLTGRKWQPWVFIEKNYFIDKMAVNNKMKAIFNHRKNTYVLAEKFRKYKSINNTKFVITQPKTEDISSGKLKYTIRLRHNY